MIFTLHNSFLLNVGENMMGMTSVIITLHGKRYLHMWLMLLNQLTFFLSTDYLKKSVDSELIKMEIIYVGLT